MIRCVLSLAIAFHWFLYPLLAADYDTLVEIYSELQALDLERLEDVSVGVFNKRAETIQRLRERLEGIESADWEVSRQIDYRLVRAYLTRIYFEHAAIRPWRRDPGFYVDRLRALAFEKLPLEEERLGDFEKRLAGVGEIVAAAKENLTEGAGELTKLAIRNLEKPDGVGHGHPYRKTPPQGVIGWYQDLVERVREHHPGLVPSAESALQSVTGFRDWLRENEERMQRASGIGARNYNAYLRNVLLMPYTSVELRIIGRRELQRSLSFLALEQQRNRDLPPLEPARNEEEYEERIREADRHIREFIRKNEILTIPDFVGEFGHNAPWIVRPEGRRNFWEEIQFRDPRPDHVHAVIPGHRFDSLLHVRDERPVRGSFSDSGRVEGWAFYLEEMMLQAGLLDDLPRTRELFYIFQAARAVRIYAELALHANDMTVDEAAAYMVENVPFMDEDVARVDCEIYLRQPGYGISYLMGRIQIESLLADRKKQLGERFNLKEFHDQFVAAGWIPVSLIRWEMTGLTDEIEHLWPSN